MYRRFQRFKKHAVPYFDLLFYAGGIISPAVGIPQVYKIFSTQTAAGVSLLSWTCYLLGALALLTYGIVHKQKPIIFMHAMVLPVYSAIILGILIYG